MTGLKLSRRRSSRASSSNRQTGRRRRAARRRPWSTDLRAEVDLREPNKLRNHMSVFLLKCGLTYNGGGPPGVQTERRGGTGPVRGLLGGKDLTGRFFFT